MKIFGKKTAVDPFGARAYDIMAFKVLVGY